MDFIGGTGGEWWRLSARLNGALRDASQRLDPDGRWQLALGSPVLIGTPDGDQVRVAVILRGGTRELPVAYVRMEKTNVDRSRIDALARRLELLARQMAGGGVEGSGRDTEIIYP